MIALVLLLAVAPAQLQTNTPPTQQSSNPAPMPFGPPPRALDHMGPPDWADKRLKQEVQNHEENRRRAEKSVEGAMGVLAQVGAENADRVTDQQLVRAFRDVREAESGLKSDLIQLVTTILGKRAQFAPWDTGFTSQAYADLSSTYYEAKYIRLRLEELLRARTVSKRSAIHPSK